MYVYRWDLDKTYLATEFDTVGQLIRTAMQSATEKKNIPGTSALMRAIRTDPDGSPNKICVVSGSPRQMRRVLEEKLRLDGVQVDDLTLKANLKNILTGRFRAIRDQIGYKLPVLLERRALETPDTREICFGDDAEMDGLVYCLYHDICAGKLSDAALDTLFDAARLYDSQIERIREAAGRISRCEPVERIFIHLETGTPVASFDVMWPRVIPTFNTFQAALVLYVDGRLGMADLRAIIDDMCTQYDYDTDRLSNSVDDALRRGLVTRDSIDDAMDSLGLRASTTFVRPLPAGGPIDYVELLSAIKAYHQARKGTVQRTLASILRLED